MGHFACSEKCFRNCPEIDNRFIRLAVRLKSAWVGIHGNGSVGSENLGRLYSNRHIINSNRQLINGIPDVDN